MTKDESAVFHALEHLKTARWLLRAAGARKTLARVRAAISSAKGALRNAGYQRTKRERGA